MLLLFLPSLQLFGIAVCSCSGEIWSIGDCDIPFTFQSTIKPLLYNIAIEQVLMYAHKHTHTHHARITVSILLFDLMILPTCVDS
jgi:hypothetical protein